MHHTGLCKSHKRSLETVAGTLVHVGESMSQIGENPERRKSNPLSVELHDLRPDAQGARWLRRHLPTGVTVLTTVIEGRYRGATVGSATMVSTEPLQMLVSIEQHNQMADWLAQSGYFALNMLPRSAQFLADQFAGFAPRASPRFEGILHREAESGAPILSESIVWVDCRIINSFPTGDHHCFIAEAISLGVGTGDLDDPLLYYLNRYRRFR